MSRGFPPGCDAASSPAAGAVSAMMSSVPLNWNVFGLQCSVRDRGEAHGGLLFLARQLRSAIFSGGASRLRVSRWGWGDFLHRRIEGQGGVQFQADLASGGQIRVVTLLEDLAEHGNRHDGAGADGRARAEAGAAP